MRFRKIVSISIAMSFSVLLATGILSYFQNHSNVTATLHTVFGLLFSLGVAFHLVNNYQALKTYFRGWLLLILTTVLTVLFLGAYLRTEPFNSMMEFGTRIRANSEKELNLTEYEIVKMDMGRGIILTIDVLASEHYWHPQMAVWIEDFQGNYRETIFVSKATGMGLFFGGRSKENFKTFDQKKDTEGDYRRVNALPVWSHARGVQYEDGMYVPSNDQPLPDAITGATIVDNFKLISSVDSISKFVLKIEINVAFDDNEYYSEYDFPDDSIYHSGTGQLGQPSIIFESSIDMNDEKDYYLMEMVGHGHHSGQTGEIFDDLSTLTTAKDIVERIVVGVEKRERYSY